MTFENLMELVVTGFELMGILVLAVGSLLTVLLAVSSWRRDQRAGLYEQARRQIGRSILLGLEILIIADIVQTVTIDPTIESAATLGVIVLVRTFLSFSLEIELEGVVPWRLRQARREEPASGTEPSV